MALCTSIEICLLSSPQKTTGNRNNSVGVLEARRTAAAAAAPSWAIDVRQSQNCFPSPFRNCSVSSRGGRGGRGSCNISNGAERLLDSRSEARLGSPPRTDDCRGKASSMTPSMTPSMPLRRGHGGGRRQTSGKSEWKLYSQVSREDYHVDNDHNNHKEAFKEAIFELEYMVREPAEVLEGLQEKLSTRDLELVLAYFAQDGRDSWCALEVFEWMQRVNRVGDDTHKLMMRIMFEWIMKLVEKEQPVEDVKSLLQDMNCVGLKPEFHIMQSIIGTYWEKGRKAEALCFVKEMLDSEVETEGEDPVVFLILKMVKAGEQKEALDLVHHLRGCGFKLKVSAYTAALVAAVVEQEQLTSAQRQLRDYERKGAIKKLQYKDWEMFQAYEANLHAEAEQMARWALAEEVPEAIPSVHERLLAMYCIAGKALPAEKSLWGMKLAGREPPWEMYNTVLGICGYRNEREAVFRILRRMEEGKKPPVKKSYSVLMGGFVKGGHLESAAEIMHLMLEKNVYPDANVMLAVLRALQKAELVGTYLKLCKSLAQAGLIEPCLLYFYIDALNLCIIRML